jgi:hypothetical protein
MLSHPPAPRWQSNREDDILVTFVPEDLRFRMTLAYEMVIN